MELLPAVGQFDAIITDPPYAETNLEWDKWPDEWPSLAIHAAKSMWCFGSLRMFMDRSGDFRDWRMSQEVIWEKHNGSNPHNDRFRRVHEIAAHFYHGEWSAVFKCPQFTNDATKRVVRRKARPPQWGDIGAASYASEDGGPRLQTSVIFARSCHGSAIHPTQKPIEIVMPLLEYAVPPGGRVLDCFAGSGVVLEAARMTGRHAVAIEGSEHHCRRIVERLAQQDLMVTADRGQDS